MKRCLLDPRDPDFEPRPPRDDDVEPPDPWAGHEGYDGPPDYEGTGGDPR